MPHARVLVNKVFVHGGGQKLAFDLCGDKGSSELHHLAFWSRIK
jgi:hypothetical protein